MVEIRRDFFHAGNPEVPNFLNGSKKVFFLVHPNYHETEGIKRLTGIYSHYPRYKKLVSLLLKKSKYPVLVAQDSRHLDSIPTSKNIFLIPTIDDGPVPSLQYYGDTSKQAWDHVFQLLKNNGVKRIVIGGSYAFYAPKKKLIRDLKNEAKLPPEKQRMPINVRMIELMDNFKDNVLSLACMSEAYAQLYKRARLEGINVSLAKKLEFPGDPVYRIKKRK
ncbi:Uncharacterised protein [uncultured archaeon]|nr:Uncharacterised protein [uncultured archaeon]